MQSIAAEGLAEAIERGELGSAIVRVDAPVHSWAAVKPAVWQALRAVRARGGPLPRLQGYPLCAFGGEYRELPVAPTPPVTALTRAGGDRAVEPGPCSGCSLRARCAPPDRWSNELQPFGPPSRLELWTRFHQRFASALSLPRDERLDTLVASHLRSLGEPFSASPITLEPSVLVEGTRVEPAIRLAIFHGPLARETTRARAMRDTLCASLEQWHAALGFTAPTRLTETLRSLPPLRTPLGFEARGTTLRTKCYVEFEGLDAAARGDVLRAIVAAVARPVAIERVDAAAVDLLCVTSDACGPCGFKAYVRADPAGDHPPFGLEPLAADGLFAVLSRRRAYAVPELLEGATRATKWDVNLREPLVTGTSLTTTLAPVLEPTARATLDAIFAHHAFRADLVAASLRRGTVGLYVDLG